jgi:putative DNA primase/helicase
MNGGRTPSREWDDARQQFIDRLPAHAVPKPAPKQEREFDPDTGLYRERQAVANGKPAGESTPSPEGCDLSDLGNSRLFVRLHGERVRFVPAWNKWLLWDGTRWRADDLGAVVEMGKSVADARWDESRNTDDRARRQFAAASASNKFITAALKLAQSAPGIPVEPAELDRNPWLLNCPNGTIDLRTGALEPHRKTDLITKLCPTPFNPDAPAPRFERFLDSVFGGDQQLAEFVQRFFGYSLTGDVSEQVLPIFWGGGSNGKSTLLNVVMNTIGNDYCLKAVSDLLMQKRHEAHPTERADLFGRRLVVCTETEDGRGMNESLVKELTGGDKIRARRMRADFFEFDPTHKLLICTNHKPRVRGTDHSIWRRLLLVPFAVQFWNAEAGETGPAELRQDKHLPAALAAEADGILAWLVRGCLAWQRSGLSLPEPVRAATAEYRTDDDLVALFIADACDCHSMYRIRSKSLYEGFQRFCDHIGERPISQRSFGETLTQRGFERKKNDGIWYLGITLTEGTE